MVLKYLTNCEVGVLPGEQTGKVFCDQWNFVDGIIGASVYYDEGCESTVVVMEFEHRPTMKIAIHGEAYLLNESGKTIEKVRA